MPTIEENKKLILCTLLRQMESELSNLFHTIEDDQDIPNDKFKEYEKKIEKLFELHNQVHEEIIFS